MRESNWGREIGHARGGERTRCKKKTGETMDGVVRKAGRIAVAGPHQHQHQHQREVFGRAAASPSAVLFGTTAECRAWLLFPRRSGNALRIEHPSHTFSPAELPEGTIGAPTSLARSLSLSPPAAYFTITRRVCFPARRRALCGVGRRHALSSSSSSTTIASLPPPGLRSISGGRLIG